MPRTSRRLRSAGKFKLTAKDSFDPVEIPYIGLLAGISQAQNSEPPYGQGGAGYDTQPPASSASQTTGSTSTGENDQLKPTYPGEPLNKPPIEAKIGPAALRVYGTVLLNISLSDSDEVGQDIPLWPFPSSTNVTLPDGTSKRAGTIHDTIFTVRQSIFGVVRVCPAGHRNVSLSGW
jgi:hypothetical protein